MADSKQAFIFVMKHEDFNLSGVVETDNNGGKVRFGVNSIANAEALTDGFYEMSTDDALAYAEKVFVNKYWSAMRGDGIGNQRVANQLADLEFVSGNESILIAQRAVNRFRDVPIEVDGKCGPLTIAAINICTDQLALLDAIKVQATTFYQQLVEKDPVKYSQQDYRSWIGRLTA